jgi:hypothetical protein
MRDWFVREIVDTGKLPLALMFLAFVVTFLFIRFSVRMIRAQVSWWPGNISSGGTHIHHVVFGVVFMAIAGAGGFSRLGDAGPWREIFAALFGCGLALVLDEFALVLQLRDVYWTEQGRLSVDAVFLAVAVLGLLLVGVVPFGLTNSPTDNSWEAALSLTVTLLLNGALVVITLAKGKIWTGLLGIFVVGLAVIGSARLARPGSPWAHKRYPAGSKKAERAQRRDHRVRARAVALRNRVQDAIAGRPSDEGSAPQ